MQNKTLWLLGTILAILTLFWGVKTYLPKYNKPSSPYAEKVKPYDKSSVRSIVIKNSECSVELKKEGEDWKVNGKKADKSKIDDLVNQLIPPIFPDIIAKTDKRYHEFNLTSDKAIRITFDDKLTWFIGKSTGSNVYVRFDGDNTVYLLKSGISSNFSTDNSDWYDKTIVAFDQTKATKITLKERTNTLVLVKKENKWTEEGSKREAKKDKVDSVLSQVSNLTAQSLYESKKEQVYPTAPTFTLIVEYDGKSETLELYKGSSDFLVKRSSDKEQFVVSEYSISSIISALK